MGRPQTLAEAFADLIGSAGDGERVENLVAHRTCIGVTPIRVPPPNRLISLVAELHVTRLVGAGTIVR
jgi:hypothetical protein